MKYFLLLLILFHTMMSAGLVTANDKIAMITDGPMLLLDVNKVITNINTEQLAAILKSQPDTAVIDVRTADEIARLGGMIEAERNYNITRGWLEFRVANIVINPDTPIVVYCGINERSPLAAQTLMQMGYSNVSNYEDGFFAWKKAGLPVEQTDKAVNSILYSRPIEVIKGVWSAIGATAPQSYANSGHNNNLSFIITDEGVVVVNAGDNYLLAQSLHNEIKSITDKKVKYVVLENAQGHAALGSSYWKEQGVPIIAHIDAKKELETYGEEGLERLKRGRRDKAEGTYLVLPDETFEDKKVIELGGLRIELLHLGPAHSPGDIIVWLPQKKLVISGDMAFHERLLPVTEHTDTGAWVKTWDKFAALNAEIVIPGHGSPTNMAEVAKYTRDYLIYMREQISILLDNDATLEDATKIDQSAYRHLDTFDELAALNASTMFRAMEFE
ncbi:MBL-fold metallo-hydrolase superfamily [hydrothermal vent metagenome]|uniref:MBL-fold metallo-hydrolase superfamily n=1 Tax=hydrothermal vent metagenome TaxID=652676 RepID=A0A3B0XED7_9ZZZZ